MHVLGDAIFPAPTMPKSGHMANQHAQACRRGNHQLLLRRPANPTPVVMNTCYSFVTRKTRSMSLRCTSTTPATKIFKTVQGPAAYRRRANEIEGKVALGWAENIWADCWPAYARHRQLRRKGPPTAGPSPCLMGAALLHAAM